LDVKPVKGGKYLISYVPYQFSDGEMVTYIARVWDVNTLPAPVVNDKGDVVSIGNNNKDYIRHYFETKFKIDRYVLQNVCTSNSKDDVKEDVLSVYEKVTNSDDFASFVNWYIQNRSDNQAQAGWVNCYINYIYGLNPDFAVELFMQYAVETGLVSPNTNVNDLVKPDTGDNDVSDDDDVVVEDESTTDGNENSSLEEPVDEEDAANLVPENVVKNSGFTALINIGRDIITASMNEADEFESNMFNLANTFISETLDDVSININRNNSRNWEVGSTSSNIADSLAGVANTGITTAGSVANTGITTAGSVANTGITTTPQVLNSVMPLLTASQEQLHQLENRLGEDIDYLIDTSLLKIARDALAARFGTLAFGGLKSAPRALIGDVSDNANGSIRGSSQGSVNIPDNIQMPGNINEPSYLEDYDLYAMLQMDKNQNGKITIREMRQAVRENRKNLPIIQRIFNVLSRKDMRDARQDRRDYNKNNPIKNGQPTVFSGGVPSNAVTSSMLNTPSYNTMPNDILGSASSNMPSPLNLSTPMQQAPVMGMGALPPLGALSDDQREQVEQQLKDQGYEVDYDNPATLDFNRDGKIDEDEIDLAVSLDRDGMNVVAKTLDRLTNKSNRQAENAAEKYNGDDEKKKGGILGRLFNREGGGETPPVSPQYSGTVNQPGSYTQPGVAAGYNPVILNGQTAGVGTAQQPVNSLQPSVTPYNEQFVGSGLDGFVNAMSGVGESIVSSSLDAINSVTNAIRGGVVNPETCPLPLADDMCEVMQDPVQKNPYVHQLLCEKYPNLIDTRQSVKLGGQSNWLFFDKFGVKYSSTPIASNNLYNVYLLSKDNGFSVEGYNNGRFMVTFDNHEMKNKRTGVTVVKVNNSIVDSPCWCVVPVKPDCRNINLPTSSSATNGSTSYEPPTGDTGSGWLHVATPPLGWTPNGWVYPPENLSPEEEAYWYWLHDGK
jgi:hypothetical protein